MKPIKIRIRRQQGYWLWRVNRPDDIGGRLKDTISSKDLARVVQYAVQAETEAARERMLIRRSIKDSLGGIRLHRYPLSQEWHYDTIDKLREENAIDKHLLADLKQVITDPETWVLFDNERHSLEIRGDEHPPCVLDKDLQTKRTPGT